MLRWDMKEIIKIRMISFLLCVSALVPMKNLAQQANGRTGAFLRMGVGARAGSLGDAYVAAASGAAALYWNPAGLMQDRGWRFEASQRRFALERNFSFAGLIFPISERSAVGLGWIGFAADGIEARSGNTATPDEYFSDHENALLLSASHRLADWLAIGSTVKAITQSLFNESAHGYSASAGVQLFLHDRLTLGANYQDFYSTYWWKDGRWENFPRTAMAGAAWQIGSRSLVTLDYHETEHEPGRVRAGLEFSSIAALPLRLGYSQNSFAAGAGLVMPLATHELRIDYHFSAQDGINGRAHAFSVAIDFGGGEGSHSVDRDFAHSNTPTTHSTKKASENRPTPIIKIIRIKAIVLNVRSGPGTQYKVIGQLEEGNKVQVTRSQGDWFEIKLGKRKRGWVNRELVEDL